MMPRNIFRVLLITSLLITYHESSVFAQKVTNLVSSTDVTKYTPGDQQLGDYYILEFDVPQEASEKRLLWAFLEFYVDASAVQKNGTRNRTPLLEVYALKSAFTGTLSMNNFEESHLPTVRNVVVGENKKIVVDISDIVRSYMETPSKNHGLIMGSLTGSRDGLFTLQEDGISQGIPARIVYHFSSL